MVLRPETFICLSELLHLLNAHLLDGFDLLLVLVHDCLQFSGVGFFHLLLELEQLLLDRDLVLVDLLLFELQLLLVVLEQLVF